MAKIIQTSRQPMTCWAVLHKTTTTKVKGSIIDRGRWKAGGGRSWAAHGRTDARGAADDDGGAGAAAEIGLAGADGDAFSAAVKQVAVLDNDATAAGIDIAIPGVVAPAGDEAGIPVGDDQAVLGQGRGVIDDDTPGAVDAADKVGQPLFAFPLQLIEAFVGFVLASAPVFVVPSEGGADD